MSGETKMDAESVAGMLRVQKHAEQRVTSGEIRGFVNVMVRTDGHAEIGNAMAECSECEIIGALEIAKGAIMVRVLAGEEKKEL